jgi:hypothetical protein
MSELTDCLLTAVPKVLDFPAEIATPPDLVSWTLETFRASFIEADMQQMESAPGDQELKISFFDQKDPGDFDRFRKAIEGAQPVHGSLALIDLCSGAGMVRDDADWVWSIHESQFANGLSKRHPMGSYLRATLWMSCGDHLYEAHCDPFDGFLVHMQGHKRVRVWPVPKKYSRKVIFNHDDFKGRMATDPIDFELQPGQVLYIPSGAMHEVVAHGEKPAVSVSFHMGSPFPMPTLCAQLNRMLKGGEVTLPPYMQSINKFKMYFFEPSHFAGKAKGSNEGIPDELGKALMGVLQSKQVDQNTMRKLLSLWWRTAISRSLYQGPYPERAAI